MKKVHTSYLDMDFLKSTSHDFIFNYELELIKLIANDINNIPPLEDGEANNELIEYIQSAEYEVNVLEQAIYYFARYHSTIQKLVNRAIEHTVKQEKIVGNCKDLSSKMNQNTYKLLYVLRKLGSLGVQLNVQHLFSQEYQNTLQKVKMEKRTTLPHQIALLNEIGFFKLDTLKNMTKENQYKLVSKLLNGNTRQVKGNILVLNPDSKEDVIRYTSHKHEIDANKYIEILSK